MVKKSCHLFYCFLLVLTQGSGQRQVTNINACWAFKRTPDPEYTVINLPHTYNAIDAFDDIPGYYRGKGYYRKIIHSESFKRDQDHFLRVHAANQNALIFLNGKEVGTHRGGYTAFTFEISEFLTYGTDTLMIVVDNSHDPGVPPLRGDFTFYGGIYRDVELIHVNHTRFQPDFFGSSGVFIDPVKVAGTSSASLRVWGWVENFDADLHQLKIELKDNRKQILIDQTAQVSSGKRIQWATTIEVEDPKLWSTADPYLYQVSCRISEKTKGKTIDEVNIPYGIRYFSFDANRGFFLNGKSQKLIGINRHQDRRGIGNALTKAHHLADMDIIGEMGVNFLRTAHYPQDQLILDECDRRGIVASMEIPLDHQITPGREFAENCRQMTLEMIYQYYNHPSVIIWAYMNEMGLGKDINKDSLEMTQVADLARELEDLIRTTDPYRYTMIPNHGQFDIYHHFALTRIPMIVGWNLYYGWYEPGVEGFGTFVDSAHAWVPDRPVIISEYGAGADPRITSFDPVRFDFSLDWTLAFHRSHLQQIMARPFIAGSAVWNMFDFGSESRRDAVPHINNKGLCGFDRQKKPVFFLYQAHLKDQPVRKIETLPPFLILPETGERTIPVSLITNQDTSLVFYNSSSRRSVTHNYVALFDIPVAEGHNVISANPQEPGNHLIGYTWTDFWQKNRIFRINLGTNFYFTPADGLALWYPGDELPAGLLQITGGKRYKPRDRGIGTDMPVALTDDDPVYQTLISDLTNLSLSLPRGRYRLALHFARFHDGQGEQSLYIQGKKYNLATPPLAHAYYVSLEAEVEDHLDIKFVGNEKETHLNGLEIIKL